MKRKDYITETKSLDHMGDILTRIRQNNGLDEWIKHLATIPPKLWPKIDKVDSDLKDEQVSGFGLFYVLIKLPHRRQEAVPVIEEYIKYHFENTWRGRTHGPRKIGNVVISEAPRRLTNIEEYIRYCKENNIPVSSDIIQLRNEEYNRVYS
jgi:hypothetical protein